MKHFKELPIYLPTIWFLCGSTIQINFYQPINP